MIRLVVLKSTGLYTMLILFYTIAVNDWHLGDSAPALVGWRSSARRD
jgi:hypothetical protein